MLSFFSLCGSLERQNLLDCMFLLLFCELIVGLVFCLGLTDTFESQSPREVGSSQVSRADFGLFSYYLVVWSKFNLLQTSQWIIFPIHHHHHHVVPQARISLTLSRHFSLSFIASVRSSGLHPASSHSCWMYVQAGRPAFARPYVGVHRSTSLMSSFLLLQQCPACLVRLTWIVFVMEVWWPYSWCLMGLF